VSRSVEFFDRQFHRQALERDYALNPFEQAVLPYLVGEVLDLGCGLGNLAIAAAKNGCRVTALDASEHAIADLARRAAGEKLAVEARVADLSAFQPGRSYDCIVSIGLLMFFPCGRAEALLAGMQRAVRPGGVAAVNVLVEGTTFMAMFDAAGGYCLFPRERLSQCFNGWEFLLFKHEDFPAPGATLKRFHTVVARKPV
jgi:tellurite methyltransferase